MTGLLKNSILISSLLILMPPGNRWGSDGTDSRHSDGDIEQIDIFFRGRINPAPKLNCGIARVIWPQNCTGSVFGYVARSLKEDSVSALH